MERQLHWKLLAASTVALGTTISLSQPGHACSPNDPGAECSASHKVPVVTTTTTTPQVAPIPVGAPPTPGLACPSGGPTPCGQPPVATPPRGACSKPGGCGPAIGVPPDSFFCGRDRQGRPATFVSTPGGVLPLVKWVSHYFARSGYDPETRCQEVSNRFDQFYRQGRLNFVTTGIVNRLPVVCVAGQLGGPCTGVLFTLKPNEDASRVIQQLFDVRAGASGPLFESGERQYIDIKNHIEYLKSQPQ